jgi:hypothetical protein
VTTEPPRARLLRTLGALDRRYVPAAAAALDRMVSARGPRLDLAPNARRILGALALVLVVSAIALLVVGT